MTLIVPKPLRGIDNIHERLIREFFGDIPKAPLAPPSDLHYLFLCFTNRCGSNFLADALLSTGKLPEAGEHYNAGTVIDNATAGGLKSLHDYVRQISASVAMNGHVVSKIVVEQLVMLTDAGILDSIIEQSSFVIVERADKLSQAISLILAEETGQWSTRQTARCLPEEVDFDHARVERTLQYIVEQNYYLDLFFAFNGLAPMRVVYEQLSRRPQACLDELAPLLSIGPLTMDPSKITLAQQAGRANFDWRRRYLRERGRTEARVPLPVRTIAV